MSFIYETKRGTSTHKLVCRHTNYGVSAHQMSIFQQLAKFGKNSAELIAIVNKHLNILISVNKLQNPPKIG